MLTEGLGLHHVNETRFGLTDIASVVQTTYEGIVLFYESFELATAVCAYETSE
jgi:hypothetical protein